MTTCRSNVKFERRFTAGSVVYRFFVTHQNEIVFAAIGGNIQGLLIGEDLFGTEFPDISVLHGTKNPVAVFRKVLHLLTEYAKTEKPDYFHFTASEENRISLYSRMVAPIQRSTGYELRHYDDGMFMYFPPGKGA